MAPRQCAASGIKRFRGPALRITALNVPSSWRKHANRLKSYALTVYFIARDHRTPALVRALAVLIAAYAFSPIDLIPDFIPVLGLLDDLVLIPLGLALVVRVTPAAILASARLRAAHAAGKPVSYPAAALIILLWLAMLWVTAYWLRSD
ncbi:MAG: DUF1232 domain-containing protein [Gammaproteobacteria bacterium]|nr:DUF1232 domain-containing protein [Gammaproteobacteria bacterium]